MVACLSHIERVLSVGQDFTPDVIVEAGGERHCCELDECHVVWDTTSGKILADQTDWKYHDRHEYHPAANIEKMNPGMMSICGRHNVSIRLRRGL